MNDSNWRLFPPLAYGLAWRETPPEYSKSSGYQIEVSKTGEVLAVLESEWIEDTERAYWPEAGYETWEVTLFENGRGMQQHIDLDLIGEESATDIAAYHAHQILKESM